MHPSIWSCALLGSLLGACASAPERDLAPSSPNHAGEPGVGRGAAAEQYQDSMLVQLTEAQRDGDWQAMERILAMSRDGATAAQRERFESFARLMRGLRLVGGEFDVRGFRVTGPARPGPLDFEMDESLPLAVVLRPAPGRDVTLRARGEGAVRTLIAARVVVEDFRVDGTSARSEEPLIRTLDTDVTLSSDTPLRLPVDEPPQPGPDVLVRIVDFRGEIRPAGLTVDGEEAAVQRIVLQPLVLRRFPKGFARVRQDPMQTLEKALERPAQYLAHVFIACWFLHEDGSSEQKEAAIGRLIGLLRSGPTSTHKTARSCLERLAGDAAPGGRDRDSWLTWWSLREAGRR